MPEGTAKPSITRPANRKLTEVPQPTVHLHAEDLQRGTSLSGLRATTWAPRLFLGLDLRVYRTSGHTEIYTVEPTVTRL